MIFKLNSVWEYKIRGFVVHLRIDYINENNIIELSILDKFGQVSSNFSCVAKKLSQDLKSLNGYLLFEE